MIIAISGSPGTGKTSISKALAKKLDANIITVKSIVNSGEIKYTVDKARNAKEIDPEDLESPVNRRIVKDKINIVEGILSHFVRSDLVIVLRCNPVVLKKRLSAKRWSRKKILENIHAEILDSTTIEAMENHRKSRIFEIDTSSSKPVFIADKIAKLLKRQRGKRYMFKGNAGSIDWTRKYEKYLMRV